MFWKAILDTQISQNRWDRCLLVYIGRHTDSVSIGQQLGVRLEECELKLPGLTLSDSIELALPILARSRIPVHSWKQEGYDILDLVLSLLRGVPAAILEILPLAKNSTSRGGSFSVAFSMDCY